MRLNDCTPRTVAFTAVALLLLALATRAAEPAVKVSERLKIKPAAAPAEPQLDQFAALRQSPALKVALAPHTGTTPLDGRIRRAQEAVRVYPDPRPQIEQLGWLFIARARAAHDAGFYKLAQQCAVALIEHDADHAGALLLRGHVAQALHQFQEAEAIARRLTAQREVPFDFGLLGDALADQGKLTEAITAYQRMVDLRPGLQAYSRIAHVRWLKGDLAGAIEAAELAARAASPADTESAAWANARLAGYRFQAGDHAKAEAACAVALSFAPNHPMALLVRGRMQLAARQANEAVETFRRAVAQDPLPEHLWWLAEALRAAQQVDGAEKIEVQLVARGAGDDPRALALFLATHGRQPDRALKLAQAELATRADVFTHDALAWAQFANGQPVEAWRSMERALAEGTQDARLFLHAAVIAAKLGRADEADWAVRARRLDHLLLPSERAWLGAGANTVSAATDSTGRPTPSPSQEGKGAGVVEPRTKSGHPLPSWEGLGVGSCDNTFIASPASPGRASAVR
jgi:tetratricopeptide (TPR) repeat protein